MNIMNEKSPKLALGTWSWGVGAVGGDEIFGNHLGEKELKPVFDAARKHNLILWDTAAVYGMGASESVLGSFVKGCNEKVLLSTKFTPQIAGDSSNPLADMLEESLQRLGTDSIDIYWIHNPADVEKWTPFLIPLVKSGKVKRVGVSNHNLVQIRRAEEILTKENVHITAVQNHYSLLYRSSEKAGILDYCNEHNIEFFAYMVLEQGALSGKYNMENPLPGESQRAQTYNPILKELQVLLSIMRKIGNRYQLSVPQVAIAWAIAKGTTPIIGVTKVSHVEEAAKAAAVTLHADDITELEYAAEAAGVDTKGSWENPMV